MQNCNVQNTVFASLFRSLRDKGYLLPGMYEMEEADRTISILHGCSALSITVMGDGRIQLKFGNGSSKVSSVPIHIMMSSINFHIREFRNSPMVKALARAQA